MATPAKDSYADIFAPLLARCSGTGVELCGQGGVSLTLCRPHWAMSLATQSAYQCGQCGNSDIVAMPLVYQQGTRAYSTPSGWGWGVSQSVTAQGASPPRRKRHILPLVVWGPPILILSAWCLAGVGAINDHPRLIVSAGPTVFILLILDVLCLLGMAYGLRKVINYNRETFPRLYRDWEHTYMCRRCGSASLIV
jgi:hypothetical protein